MATDSINLKITVDANQAQQSTTNYRAKIRELKEEMVELEVSTNGLANATEEQRARYAALEQQAGQISDALGDVSARIQANADDYQMFNAALEGLKGGAAVAQGLVGTLDLLGLSNSGVEQVAKTLMSLQGIMNSINAVQQVFNKDSKVRIALQKLLSTEVKKTAVAEGAATLATGALAAGEGVATKTSFTLAGACKAVGTAIKSIPVIGWILAAVAALISLTKLVAGLLSDGDEGIAQQEKMSEQLENQQKQYEEVDSKIIECRSDFEKWNYILQTANKDSKIYKETLKNLENELGVSLQNQQVDVQTLNKLEDIHLQIKSVQLQAEYEQNQYLANRNKLQQINNVLSAAATLDHKDRAQFIQDELSSLGISEQAAEDYAAAIHNGMNDHISWQDALANTNGSTALSYQRLNDSVDSYADKSKERVNQIIELNNKQDKIIEESGLKRINTDNKVSNNRKKTAEEKKKEEEAAAAAEKKRLEDLVKNNETATGKIEKYWKTYNDDIEKNNEETYEGRLDNLGREYAQITDTLDKELADYKTYYNSLSEEDKKALGDKLLTIEQFEAEQQKARDVALANYKKNVEKENEEEAKRQKERERNAIDSQNNIDNAVLAKRLANLQEGSEEYFELQKEIEQERFEQEMEDLRRREEDGEITKAELRALELEKEAEHQRNITAIQEDEDRKRIELTQNRISTVGSILTNMSDFVSTLMETELEEAEGNEKKQKEIKKKYATAQAVMKIGQIGIDTALGIMGVWSQVMQLGPIAGPILGAILSATIGALGAANTVKAIQEKNKIMKAGRGAYVVGASHTSGGVNYELEGGEIVLNKNVARIPQYRAIASAMNVSTGGIPLGGGGLENGAGFGVTREDVQTIVQQTVAGIAAIPVVVSAQTISERQRQVNVTEQRSQI